MCNNALDRLVWPALVEQVAGWDGVRCEWEGGCGTEQARVSVSETLGQDLGQGLGFLGLQVGFRANGLNVLVGLLGRFSWAYRVWVFFKNLHRQMVREVEVAMRCEGADKSDVVVEIVDPREVEGHHQYCPLGPLARLTGRGGTKEGQIHVVTRSSSYGAYSKCPVGTSDR
ncbi:hypothetical protein GOBAR_AA02310 [Gossypium barbadense]|uniref:Uncharacterized protein n=1 Tax=Gossypium barbadense TaxID=3634 RepID=A0A2P5YRP1_GOSBA|nr:hypothetical protein GOBAR_AA02310 [Gossypium barbadense]